jgi:L-cysteine/cystine lyase
LDTDELRREFPVLERLAYLNTGTDGPIPRTSAQAASARLAREVNGGRCSPDPQAELGSLAERARDLLGALVDAPADEVALTQSTTDGVNVVLAGLDLGPDDEVLTSDEEHPGLLAPLAALMRRTGVEIRVAPFGGLEEAVTDRTRLIALSHVSWMTGATAPLQRLGETGVPVLVDGAQAAGAIPVTVRTLGSAFYAGSGQKWLCGPNGTGFLHVRSDWIERLGMPRPGFVTVAEGSDPLQLEPRAAARRFDTSEPSGPALAWLTASLELLAEFGWERIFEQAAAGAERLRESLAPAAEPVPGARTPLVSFAPRGIADPDAAGAAARRLAGEGVIVRAIPGQPWLRASVGAWTTEADLERLLAAL